MIEIVQKAWGWTGLEPAEIVRVNAFGNCIVRAKNGTIWRICPEELSCTQIAVDGAEFKHISETDDFRSDFGMERLVAMATANLGELDEERCYCLKIPAVLGGKYTLENIGTIGINECIAFSGDVARQIKDLPEGTPIQIRFVD